jgi:uncharacterized protein YqgC (DUF456 family)
VKIAHPGGILMSVFEALLIIVTALALIIQFIDKLPKALPRWLDFLPAALLVYTLILILFAGFNGYMIVVYIMILVIFLQTIKHMIRPTPTPNPSRWQLVWAVVGLILGMIGLVVGIIFGPMIASAAGENLSRKSWTEAFEQTNDILAHHLQSIVVAKVSIQHQIGDGEHALEDG